MGDEGVWAMTLLRGLYPSKRITGQRTNGDGGV